MYNKVCSVGGKTGVVLPTEVLQVVVKITKHILIRAPKKSGGY